jgi:hypothetical protein
MFGSSLPPVVCRRSHVLFMLFVFVCAQWCQIRLDYMSNMASVLEEAWTAYPSRAHGFKSVLGGVSVAHLLSFLCFCVCLSSSCVLCTQCFQCLWIAHYWLSFRLSLTFILYIVELVLVQNIQEILTTRRVSINNQSINYMYIGPCPSCSLHHAYILVFS